MLMTINCRLAWGHSSKNRKDGENMAKYDKHEEEESNHSANPYEKHNQTNKLE